MVMISLECSWVGRTRWRCPEESRVLLPAWGKVLPKIVDGTKEFEYTHRWTLLVIETHVRFVLSYQQRFPYPELTLDSNNLAQCVCNVGDCLVSL
jgi:hypothetical protein